MLLLSWNGLRALSLIEILNTFLNKIWKQHHIKFLIQFIYIKIMRKTNGNYWWSGLTVSLGWDLWVVVGGKISTNIKKKNFFSSWSGWLVLPWEWSEQLFSSYKTLPPSSCQPGSLGANMRYLARITAVSASLLCPKHTCLLEYLYKRSRSGNNDFAAQRLGCRPDYYRVYSPRDCGAAAGELWRDCYCVTHLHYAESQKGGNQTTDEILISQLQPGWTFSQLQKRKKFKLGSL